MYLMVSSICWVVVEQFPFRPQKINYLYASHEEMPHAHASVNKLAAK